MHYFVVPTKNIMSIAGVCGVVNAITVASIYLCITVVYCSMQYIVARLRVIGLVAVSLLFSEVDVTGCHLPHCCN